MAEIGFAAHPMAPTTKCVHCGTVGFVRKEHVLKGATEYVQFYCGRCGVSWTHTTVGPIHRTTREAAGKPDRSRS